MGTCLQSIEVWIDMSQGIIQIIQHSTVISVEGHIQGLVIWRCIKELVLDPLLLLLPRGVVLLLLFQNSPFGERKGHLVVMKESDNLTALQAAVTSFQPSLSTYQRDHSAYKFQMAVDVIFHKAVDPTVIFQPAVTLTPEVVAVYGAPPLEDINRQLLNPVEIYEHNGSGWVFSHFASLQFTLWHVDPLRASTFVPLPEWIRDRKATTNIIGTGNDCFKWAVLAGMHPTTADNPNHMVNYVEHASSMGGWVGYLQFRRPRGGGGCLHRRSPTRGEGGGGKNVLILPDVINVWSLVGMISPHCVSCITVFNCSVCRQE